MTILSLISNTRFVRPGLVALMLCSLLLAAQIAFADQIIVMDGGCTLVDAIIAANTDARSGKCPAGNGADTILLSKPVVLTSIVDTTDGSNGLPSITSDITLVGNGLSIQRQAPAGVNFRIFHIASTGTLTLEDVIIRGGTLLVPVPDGAGIYNAGGGLNVIRSGLTNHGTSQGRGGAIYNEAGTVVMTQSTITASGALAGGGIYNTGGGHVEISASRIDGSSMYPTSVGTALYNDVSSTITLETSAVAGIYNAGQMTVTNTTIFGPKNENGFIDNVGSGNMVVNFSTAINNPVGGYIRSILHNDGALELNNSIVFDTVAAECYGSGTFTGSSNLGTTSACPDVIDLLPADSVSIQPHLYLASGKIGSTSSYAYNRLGACGLVDKNYFTRDPQCDIGAYEYTGPAIAGQVWQDFTGSGVRTSHGIAGVTLTLDDDTGTPLATAISTYDGRFWFSSLTPGTYTVTITLPDGYVLTRKGYVGAGDIADSDADPATGVTDPILVATYSETIEYQADFGIYIPVTLTGTLYQDTNENGVFDPGESPIPYVEIAAHRIDPSATYTTSTKPDGSYRLTGMLPGLYTISFDLPSDYYVSEPVGMLSAQMPERDPALPASAPGSASLPQAASVPDYEVNIASEDGAAMQRDFGFLRASPSNARPDINRFATNTPTLSFGPVSWAAGYEIQVDNNANFSSPVFEDDTLSPDARSITTSPLPEGKFYWRVRAKRADGRWGAWSKSDSFVVLTG